MQEAASASRFVDGGERREGLSTNADTCRQMQTNANVPTGYSLPHAALPSVGWRRGASGRRAVRCVPAWQRSVSQCCGHQQIPSDTSCRVAWHLVLFGPSGRPPMGALDGFGGPGCCAKWEQRQNRRQSITRQFEQLSRAFVDSQERTRVTRCVDRATDNGPLDVIMMMMNDNDGHMQADEKTKAASGPWVSQVGRWPVGRRGVLGSRIIGALSAYCRSTAFSAQPRTRTRTLIP